MPLPLLLDQPVFPLGRIVMTPSVEPYLPRLNNLLRRHANADWGDLDDEDKDANNQALKSGGRLLSAYNLGDIDDTRIWIVTEHDRSVTTILLPSDY